MRQYAQFDATVHLSEGRMVPASIVARVASDDDVQVESIEAIGNTNFGRHVVVVNGEDLTNRLAEGELIRLRREAERVYFASIRHSDEGARPLEAR